MSSVRRVVLEKSFLAHPFFFVPLGLEKNKIVRRYAPHDKSLCAEDPQSVGLASDLRYYRWRRL